MAAGRPRSGSSPEAATAKPLEQSAPPDPDQNPFGWRRRGHRAECTEHHHAAVDKRDARSERSQLAAIGLISFHFFDLTESVYPSLYLRLYPRSQIYEDRCGQIGGSEDCARAASIEGVISAAFNHIPPSLTPNLM